ncbi:UNVERIFIED_CONTAM: hypothetical protein FKN15_007700 [Acipenser sinensis]
MMLDPVRQRTTVGFLSRKCDSNFNGSQVEANGPVVEQRLYTWVCVWWPVAILVKGQHGVKMATICTAT